MPRDFEWTFRCYRRDDPVERAKFPRLALLPDAAAAHFTAPGNAPSLPFQPEQHLRLRLPAQARQEAERILALHSGSGPVLAVLPSGGGERAGYPSTGSWLLMLRELRATWPDATITLIGKTAGAHWRRSSAMPQSDAAELMAAVDAVDGYDLPLLVQLALVQRAALLFSPHSGFSFAALAVGTPWLALSGGAWFEYFHNGVPFYSLLPDTARFPSFGGVAHQTEDSDGSGVREASMTRKRIEETIPSSKAAGTTSSASRLTSHACFRHWAATSRRWPPGTGSTSGSSRHDTPVSERRLVEIIESKPISGRREDHFVSLKLDYAWSGPTPSARVGLSSTDRPPTWASGGASVANSPWFCSLISCTTRSATTRAKTPADQDHRQPRTTSTSIREPCHTSTLTSHVKMATAQ